VLVKRKQEYRDDLDARSARDGNGEAGDVREGAGRPAGLRKRIRPTWRKLNGCCASSQRWRRDWDERRYKGRAEVVIA
jgi:hypothetical protein